MNTPKKITVYLHTEKMYQAYYAETFRMMVEALVSDKAIFIVVLSDSTMNCGMATKEKILSGAEGLFKIYEESD